MTTDLGSDSVIEAIRRVNPLGAVGAGYTESKWVTEEILVTAAEATPLRPIIIRVGQLSGGPNGCWKPSQWVPSIIRSAITLGSLPDGPDVSKELNK